MPYDSGTVNPDGSLTFTGTSGSLTTAPTPSANAFLETLQRRQEQSAPLAANGPARPPLVMSDAPLDMSAPKLAAGGPAPGTRVGFYGQNAFTPDAAPGGGAPSVVPGLAPGAQISFGAGGEATVAPGGPPVIQSGASDIEARKANEAFVARKAAEGAAAPPAAGAVDPGGLVQNPNAGGPGATGGPQRGQNGFDAAADMHARSAAWELQNANRAGGSGPKPGTYQTGQTEKVKVDGGKDPDSVLNMAEANREKAFADRDAAQAAAAHEADVAARMQFPKFMQQGADDNLARKKEESLRGLQDAFEQREKEVNETVIDPQEFWGDKTMGDRLVYLISAAVTGYVNGKAGIAGNQVLAGVQKRIDENVAAQIRNLGTKKEGLTTIQRAYQQAKEQWGDETVARNAAKLVALTAAEKLARQQASLTKSEAVAKAADKFYSDVSQDKQKLIFDSQGAVSKEVDKTFKVVTPGASGSGGAPAKNPFKTAAGELDKSGDAQANSKKYNEESAKKGPSTQRVVVNGTAFDMPHTGMEEGAAIRKKFSLGDVGKSALARIEKRYNDNLADRWAATASAAQENDVGVLTETLSVMKDQGMIKEPDVQRLTSALLSPRSGKDTIQSTKALINDALKAALTQGGAVPVKK